MQIKLTITPEDYVCLKRIKLLIDEIGIEDTGIIAHILQQYDELIEQTR